MKPSMVPLRSRGQARSAAPAVNWSVEVGSSRVFRRGATGRVNLRDRGSSEDRRVSRAQDSTVQHWQLASLTKEMEQGACWQRCRRRSLKLRWEAGHRTWLYAHVSHRPERESAGRLRKTYTFSHSHTRPSIEAKWGVQEGATAAEIQRAGR